MLEGYDSSVTLDSRCDEERYKHRSSRVDVMSDSVCVQIPEANVKIRREYSRMNEVRHMGVNQRVLDSTKREIRALPQVVTDLFGLHT